MSYDIYLESPVCPECGNKGFEPELPNPTYNLTPIFDFALTGEGLPNPETNEAAVVLLRKETDRPRGLRLLNTMSGKESEAVLAAAEHRLHDPALESQFQSMVPSNGWGTLEGAREVVRRLRESAHRYPNHTWRVQ